MMRKLAAATAAALGATVLIGTPAEAAPGGCLQVNVICFYNTDSDSGPIQIYPSSVDRNTCLDVPDNLTSYIKNKTGLRWRVFKNPNCSDAFAPIYPWSEGPMNATWNNVIGATVRTSQTTKHAGPFDPTTPYRII